MDIINIIATDPQGNFQTSTAIHDSQVKELMQSIIDAFSGAVNGK